MKKKRLESVAQARREAEKRLPKAVYWSLSGGSEKGLTQRLGVEAFDDIGFRSRAVLDVPAVRAMNTTVLGQEISLPVIISPASGHAMAPGGEVNAARAAARAGTTIGQSNFAPEPFEDVAAANPKAFFQIYWVGDRDEIAAHVERVRKAGAKALIYTVDLTPYSKKDTGTPVKPRYINLAAYFKYAPTALSHPSWTLGFLRHGGMPDFRVPNAATPQGTPTMVENIEKWSSTPIPTWKDIAWLRELWGGPFMMKGVLSTEDARRSVDIGADAISVSNHGGNGLDGDRAPIRYLPAVIEAVGDQVEILYDGGIRRGGDVAKALALGARAVLVGRPWLWGLGARGEQGVYEVLEIFREGLDNVLVHLGHNSIDDLSTADLVIPDGFILQPDSRPRVSH